jgi:hypothetical protein
MSTSENTKLWDELRRVPPDQLKGFSRAGGFKGTAIKPMWSFHKMTEVFGPVGTGWTVSEPAFHVVPGDNKEVLVFCTVAVTAGKNFFHGVGGDKIVKYIPANEQYKRAERWENDDEAFKKAYTDALTNALKLLGVGADIHMGLWDGNKYIDEKPEPANDPVTDKPKAGPQLLTREQARALYKQLETELVSCRTRTEITQWQELRSLEIEKLGDWRSYIDKAVSAHTVFIEKLQMSEA